MRTRGVSAVLASAVIATGLVLAPQLSVSATRAPGWRVPADPLSRNAEWLGVDAVNGDDIWAVGARVLSVDTEARAAHWDGSGWTEMGMPDGGTHSELLSVDLSSSTDGWAVGHVGPDMLIDRWNGTSWSTETVPQPGKANELRAVGSIGSTEAWAVGRNKPTTDFAALAMHWDGLTWTHVDVSGLGASTLDAVEPVGSGDVWVGGSTSAGRPKVWHWDGLAWSSTPISGVGDGAIEDIEVFGAGNVWAVGFTAGGDATKHALAAHWNGSSWAVQNTPERGTQGSRLDGVDGTSSTDLWLVGAFGLEGGGQSSLALRRTAAGWSVSPTANDDKYRGELQDAAAISASDVWAVGTPTQHFGGAVAHEADVELARIVGGKVDQPLQIGGSVLTSRNAFPGGWIVRVTREDPDGRIRSVGKVPVDDRGGFTLRDVPLFRGVVRYRATVLAPSPWTVHQALVRETIDGLKAYVGLKASRRTVTFGRETTLKVHLGSDTSDRSVRVFAIPEGGSRKVISSGNVNRDGNFQTDVKPRWNTTYQASFGGDERYEPALSDKVMVSVRPVLASKMVQADRRVGRYAIYDYDPDCPPAPHDGCPTVAVSMRPSLSGVKVFLYLDVYVNGQWYNTSASTWRTSPKGTVKVSYYYSRDSTLFGLPRRIVAYFPGNAYYAPNRSPYVYYKVIR